MEYNGYDIYQPTSGGKAGKHKNITSSLQVRNIPLLGGGIFSLKNVVYVKNDTESYKRALARAKKFIDGLNKENNVN